MKRSVLFLLMMLVFMGMKAATDTYTVNSVTFVVEDIPGSSQGEKKATVTIGDPSDFENFAPQWNTAPTQEVAQKIKDLKFIGKISAGVISKLHNSGLYPAVRLDLSEATNYVPTSINGGVQKIIMPQGSALPTADQTKGGGGLNGYSNLQYIITPSNNGSSFTIYGNNNNETWVDDAVLTDGCTIYVTAPSTLSDDTKNKLANKNITVNMGAPDSGFGGGVSSKEDLTLTVASANAGDVAAAIAAVDTEKYDIVGLKISGTVGSDDYTAMAALDKVVTVDYSGITSGFDGMQFPVSATKVTVPGAEPFSKAGGTLTVTDLSMVDGIVQVLSTFADIEKVVLPSSATEVPASVKALSTLKYAYAKNGTSVILHVNGGAQTLLDSDDFKEYTSLKLSGNANGESLTIQNKSGEGICIDLSEMSNLPNSALKFNGCQTIVVLPRGNGLPTTLGDIWDWNSPYALLAPDATGASLTIHCFSGNHLNAVPATDKNVVAAKSVTFNDGDSHTTSGDNNDEYVVANIWKKGLGSAVTLEVGSAGTAAVAGDVKKAIKDAQDEGNTVIGLIVTGAMDADDYAAASALTTVKTVDYSGVPSGLAGMSVPSSATTIRFPGGAVYSEGTLTYPSGATNDDMKSVLDILKAAGITPTNVVLPSGSTNANGVLTLSDDTKLADDVATLKALTLDTPASVVFASGTTFVNGTLTVSDADDNADKLGSIRQALTDGLGLSIGTVKLPGGYYYNGENGLLSSPSTATEQQIADTKTKLNAAGFTVNGDGDSIEKIGEYVSIVNGVVVLTVPAGNDYSDIKDNLTEDEKTKIRAAENLKMVGDFSKNLWTDTGLRDMINENLKGLDLSEAIIHKNQKIEKWKSTLTSLVLPTDPNYTEIPEGFFSNHTALTSLHIPANIVTIGDNAFQGTGSSHLTELTFANPSHLQTIGSQAFANLQIVNLEIPNSVTLIKKNAFSDCTDLKKITFLGGDSEEAMTIQGEAFGNVKTITDVYVETTKKIVCNTEAFSRDITFAHGNPDSNLATLHYPEQNVNDYVNMNDDYAITYEIAKDPGKYHSWLLKRFNYATTNPHPANGWWEFVSSGPTKMSDDGTPVKETTYPTGKVLTTFSHYKYDHLVPAGMKAYIVNDVEVLADGSVKLGLFAINVIPKMTGVILYGRANAEDKEGNDIMLLNMCNLVGDPITDENGTTTGYEEAYPLNRPNWDRLKGDEDRTYLRNFLMPTTDSEGNPLSVKPYDTDPTTGRVTMRNYGMSWYSKTDPGKKARVTTAGPDDFKGFFRLKAGKMAAGKAFLQLPSPKFADIPEDMKTKSQFDIPENLEGIIIPDNVVYQENGTDYDQHFRLEATSSSTDVNNTSYSYMSVTDRRSKGLWVEKDGTDMEWSTDWGTRPATVATSKFAGEPYFEEEEEGVATLIVPATWVTMADDDAYYTLQGVRVSRPAAPGIYVKNGKKVIVK